MTDTRIYHLTPDSDNGLNAGVEFHLPNMPEKQQGSGIESSELRFNAAGNKVSEDKYGLEPVTPQSVQGAAKPTPQSRRNRMRNSDQRDARSLGNCSRR